MHNSKWPIRLGAIILFIIGFCISWWPLMFFAPFVAMYFGSWLLAVVLACLADLLFGVPVGMLHWLVYPCTVLVLLCIAARTVLIRHLR